MPSIDSRARPVGSSRPVWEPEISRNRSSIDAAAPGTPEISQSLSEVDLAERYEVSRTPVREALMRLDHDGVVERQRRGYQVRILSPEEVLEIYEARSVIEGAAAAAAAERHTATDRVRISAANRYYQELDDPDPVKRVQANVDFHSTIWAASQNRAYADLLERLNLQFLRFPNTTLTYPGRWEASKHEHQELTEAILKRQPALASELARLHTDSAGRIRERIWEEAISREGIHSSRDPGTE